MNMNDDELRQAMGALESYQQQLDNVTRQVRLLQASRDEASRADQTFQTLAATKAGGQVLVPVGATSFVNVIVAPDTKAIVNIGSQTSTSKDLKDASAFMQDSIKEIQGALSKALAAMQELQTYTQELGQAVQAEYRARKQGPTQ